MVKVLVLTVKHAAVVLEGGDLSTTVVVAGGHRLVGETEFFLFASSDDEGVVGGALTSLQIVEVGGEVTVAAELSILSTLQIGFLGKLGIEVTAQVGLILLQTGLLTTSTTQVSLSAVVGFSGPAQFKGAGFSLLSQISGLFLCLIQLVVSRFDSGGSLGIFMLFEVVQISKSVNFIGVTGLLVTEGSELMH